MNTKSTTIPEDKKTKVKLDLKDFKGKVYKSIKEFSEDYRDKLYAK